MQKYFVPSDVKTSGCACDFHKENPDANSFGCACPNKWTLKTKKNSKKFIQKLMQGFDETWGLTED